MQIPINNPIQRVIIDQYQAIILFSFNRKEGLLRFWGSTQWGIYKLPLFYLPWSFKRYNRQIRYHFTEWESYREE
ncbi:hypothetical protein HW44_06730 [Nitrosococcus oceani]|nr:hypothetical protein HW44_06730 [Nitrosococcus oceani]